MELKFNKKVSQKVEVGDVLVFSNGNAYLVCNDYDGDDYRYVDLKHNKVSYYANDTLELIDGLLSENKCTYEVIKADNLVLGVK